MASKYQLVNGEDIHSDARCADDGHGVCTWDGEPIHLLVRVVEQLGNDRQVVVEQVGSAWAFGLQVAGEWTGAGGYMPTEAMAEAEARRIARGIRYDEARMRGVDAVEVWRVRELEAECEPILPDDPTPATFFSVYQHVNGEGCEALTDHTTREAALAEAEALGAALRVPVYDYSGGAQ